MFEQFAGHHHACGAITQREPGRIAPNRQHSMLAGNAQGRGAEIDADMAVGRGMGGHEATAAAEIEQDFARDERSRHQASTSDGQPVQSGERALGPPPGVGEIVVLPDVVAVSDRCTFHRSP